MPTRGQQAEGPILLDGGIRFSRAANDGRELRNGRRPSRGSALSFCARDDPSPGGDEVGPENLRRRNFIENPWELETGEHLPPRMVQSHGLGQSGSESCAEPAPRRFSDSLLEEARL